MNTIFKHKILVGAMLCGALFGATSCEDSEGLKVTPEVPYADKTMYEVMTSDPDLTDFIEVINSCGEHCADSLFNKSRVYTVWAPKNGSFNKESLMEQVKAGNRENVFNRFVKAHVANHLHAANGTVEDKILMLNNKVVTFKGNRVDKYTFDGQVVEETNIRTWNGILHKISEPSEYKYSIWEYLKLDSRVDSVAKFLYAFDDTKFSASSSVMGPIVNGEQTYLDSVFVTTNKLLGDWEGVGKLNVEDSTYTVYVPTNEAWNEVVKTAYKHFNYHNFDIASKEFTAEVRDSLRNHYSRINAIKYMTYSDNDQRYIENSEDSIYPMWKGTSVFTGKHLFAKERLEENVVFEEKLSNGTFKIIDKSPFNMFELWHDTIKVEGESETMRTLSNSQGLEISTPDFITKEEIEKDSLFVGTRLSGNSYYAVESASRTPVTLTYKLPDALSASYKVAVIIVPAGFPNVVREGEFAAKSSKLTMTLKHIDANNKKKELAKKSNVLNDPFNVDTIYLTDNKGNSIFTFPYCEYYKTSNPKDYNLEIEVKTAAGTISDKSDRSVRIDAILLIPVEDPE